MAIPFSQIEGKKVELTSYGSVKMTGKTTVTMEITEEEIKENINSLLMRAAELKVLLDKVKELKGGQGGS